MFPLSQTGMSGFSLPLNSALLCFSLILHFRFDSGLKIDISNSGFLITIISYMKLIAANTLVQHTLLQNFIPNAVSLSRYFPHCVKLLEGQRSPLLHKNQQGNFSQIGNSSLLGSGLVSQAQANRSLCLQVARMGRVIVPRFIPYDWATRTFWKK